MRPSHSRKNGVRIDELCLLEVTDIERDRVVGTVFCQYRPGAGRESTSLRMTLSLDTDDGREVDDFRGLSLDAIERLFLRKLERFVNALPRPLQRIDLAPMRPGKK
jgi:hypothetical protein